MLKGTFLAYSFGFRAPSSGFNLISWVRKLGTCNWSFSTISDFFYLISLSTSFCLRLITCAFFVVSYKFELKSSEISLPHQFNFILQTLWFASSSLVHFGLNMEFKIKFLLHSLPDQFRLHAESLMYGLCVSSGPRWWDGHQFAATARTQWRPAS